MKGDVYREVHAGKPMLFHESETTARLTAEFNHTSDPTRDATKQKNLPANSQNNNNKTIVC